MHANGNNMIMLMMIMVVLAVAVLVVDVILIIIVECSTLDARYAGPPTSIGRHREAIAIHIMIPIASGRH